MQGQPQPAVQPQPAFQPQPAVQPQPQPAVQPQPQPQPAVDFMAPRSSIAIAAGDPRKRVVGGIFLGAGVAFSAIAAITFAGKAGQTEIGSQGLITFDGVGYNLQPRIPRVLLGATFTVAGSLMAGLGGKLFAANAGGANDPITTLKRQRRVRSTGAILTGSGGAAVLTGLFFLVYGAGEWGSIPDVIVEFQPQHAQSAHNAASFFSYGAGLLAVGTGSLAAGLGLLSGNSQAIRTGITADRNGAGVAVSGRF